MKTNSVIGYIPYLQGDVHGAEPLKITVEGPDYCFREIVEDLKYLLKRQGAKNIQVLGGTQ